MHLLWKKASTIVFATMVSNKEWKEKKKLQMEKNKRAMLPGHPWGYCFSFSSTMWTSKQDHWDDNAFTDLGKREKSEKRYSV